MASAASGSSSSASHPLVESVREYFYSDGLTERMEQWAQTHCAQIDLSLDAGESLLSYSGLFKEWCAMFEGALETFIEGKGGTVRAFYEALADGRKPGSHAAWADDALFVTMMQSTAEYEFWLEMMVETAQQAQQEGKHDEGDEGGGGGGDGGDGGGAETKDDAGGGGGVAAHHK